MISYGGYDFPLPHPFVSFGDSPIVYSGHLDHSLTTITLNGEITGCGLPSIKQTKDEIVHALSSGYQQLTIGNSGYNYAKPISINFQDSSLRRNLPYQISFEVYSDTDFSDFFGIQDPQDTWTFSEQADRIVAATHRVSARGVKTSADSLLAARNFVNSRLNGFENISLFFSGDTSILTDKSEEINRASNFYGINETYKLSESYLDDDRSDSIVRKKSTVSYVDNNLNVSINGTIDGGISGSADTGYFTVDDAKLFAQQSVERSKIEYENDLYSSIFRDPVSYNYNVNTGANLIDFSFEFSNGDSLQTGDVLHTYSTSINASKDEGTVSVSIDGEVRYNTVRDIFSTNQPETEERYKKVESYFSGVSPYAIAQQHFSWFNDGSLPYNNLPLNDSLSQHTINKVPHESLISYQYSFDNRIDFFSGLFKTADFRIETEHPITAYNVNPTTDFSFSVQSLYDTLEKRNISFNGVLNSGVNINTAIDYVNSWVGQYSGDAGSMTRDTISTGINRVSISKSFVLQ